MWGTALIKSERHGALDVVSEGGKKREGNKKSENEDLYNKEGSKARVH